MSSSFRSSVQVLFRSLSVWLRCHSVACDVLIFTPQVGTCFARPKMTREEIEVGDDRVSTGALLQHGASLLAVVPLGGCRLVCSRRRKHVSPEVVTPVTQPNSLLLYFCFPLTTCFFRDSLCPVFTEVVSLTSSLMASEED